MRRNWRAREGDAKLPTALERNCERLSKALTNTRANSPAKLRALIELNHEFHHLVWSASGSATLLRIIESLRSPHSPEPSGLPGKRATESPAAAEAAER